VGGGMNPVARSCQQSMPGHANSQQILRDDFQYHRNISDSITLHYKRSGTSWSSPCRNRNQGGTDATDTAEEGSGEKKQKEA
jgi:hypothetical protein